jgi:hypothetical protein
MALDANIWTEWEKLTMEDNEKLKELFLEEEVKFAWIV